MKEFNCKKAMSLKEKLEEIDEMISRVKHIAPDGRRFRYCTVDLSDYGIDFHSNGFATEEEKQHVLSKCDEAWDDVLNAYNESCKKLEDAIREAEGRATARTITANGIILELLDITEKLHISKKAMNGIKLYCDTNAQSFPGAYKYIPQSTVFKAEFRNGSWRITEVKRDTCGTTRVRIIHSEESKAAILARFSRW